MRRSRRAARWLVLAAITGLAVAMLAVPAAAQTAAGATRADSVPSPYGVRQTWTSRDKWYHFGVSAAGAAALYSGARAVGMRRGPAVALAVGVVGALGVYREISDSRRPGKYFSEKDLLWNAGGIALGIAVPDFLFFRRPRPRGPE